MVGSTMVLTTDICSGLEIGTSVKVTQVVNERMASVESMRKNVGKRAVHVRHLVTPEEFKNGGWLVALGNKAVLPKDFNPDNYTIEGLVGIRKQMQESSSVHPDALTPRELYMLNVIEQLALSIK